MEDVNRMRTRATQFAQFKFSFFTNFSKVQIFALQAEFMNSPKLNTIFKYFLKNILSFV